MAQDPFADGLKIDSGGVHRGKWVIFARGDRLFFWESLMVIAGKRRLGAKEFHEAFSAGTSGHHRSHHLSVYATKIP